MRAFLFILISFVTLLSGCGGGGGSSNSPPSSFPVGRQNIGGVSLIPLPGNYNGSGQYNNVQQNVGCTQTETYPMWGMFGCEYSRVGIVSRTGGGWIENHQLPAHVASHSTTVEYDALGNLVKDSAGCTFKNTDGSTLTLPKHPAVPYGTKLNVSLIRVCSQIEVLYDVVINVRGDDTFPITEYWMYAGGKRVMYIVLMNNIIGGALNTSEINVSTLDTNGNVVTSQSYVTLFYLKPV